LVREIVGGVGGVGKIRNGPGVLVERLRGIEGCQVVAGLGLTPVLALRNGDFGARAR
jgi:hypothetical protein